MSSHYSLPLAYCACLKEPSSLRFEGSMKDPKQAHLPKGRLNRAVPAAVQGHMNGAALPFICCSHDCQYVDRKCSILSMASPRMALLGKYTMRKWSGFGQLKPVPWTSSTCSFLNKS